MGTFIILDLDNVSHEYYNSRHNNYFTTIGNYTEAKLKWRPLFIIMTLAVSDDEYLHDTHLILDSTALDTASIYSMLRVHP